VRRCWRGWNGLGDAPGASPSLPLPSLSAWTALVRAWREKLQAQADLTTRLIDFVAAATPRPADRAAPAG
jgi:hypothetical protein